MSAVFPLPPSAFSVTPLSFSQTSLSSSPQPTSQFPTFSGINPWSARPHWLFPWNSHWPIIISTFWSSHRSIYPCRNSPYSLFELSGWPVTCSESKCSGWISSWMGFEETTASVLRMMFESRSFLLFIGVWKVSCFLVGFSWGFLYGRRGWDFWFWGVGVLGFSSCCHEEFSRPCDNFQGRFLHWG